LRQRRLGHLEQRVAAVLHKGPRSRSAARSSPGRERPCFHRLRQRQRSDEVGKLVGERVRLRS